MDAVKSSLSAFGATDSPRGVGAIVLAQRIESARTNGAELAALHRELRLTLDQIEAAAAPAEDDLIEAAKADLYVVS